MFCNLKGTLFSKLISNIHCLAYELFNFTNMLTTAVEGASRLFWLTRFQYGLGETPNLGFYHLPSLLFVLIVCLAEKKGVPILKSFIRVSCRLGLQHCKWGKQKHCNYPALHINFILKRKYSKDQKKLKKYFTFLSFFNWHRNQFDLFLTLSL